MPCVTLMWSVNRKGRWLLPGAQFPRGQQAGIRIPRTRESPLSLRFREGKSKDPDLPSSFICPYFQTLLFPN